MVPTQKEIKDLHKAWMAAKKNKDAAAKNPNTTPARYGQLHADVEAAKQALEDAISKYEASKEK